MPAGGNGANTTDHVLLETWLLLRRRIHRSVADRFWEGLRSGVADIEIVLDTDLEAAWRIGEDFDDQDFSITDRTSFAVMERLGLRRVAAFDDDFAIYRFGGGRRERFAVIR